LAQLAAWNESHQDVKRSPDIASLKELSVKELEIDPLESSLADETPKR